MKLVRNTTSDGSCKYALLRIDKMLKDGEFTFIQDFLEKYPELKEYIEFGQPHSEEEFFVIKLKDINSTRALTAYVLEADKTDPEFALEVMDLALRSGKRHHKCKQPDLLQANNPFGDFNKPNIPFFSPPDGRYLMFGDNKRNHIGRKPDNLEDSEIIKNTRETIVDYPYSPITSIILEPPQFPRSELNSESLDFPKQNGKVSEIYDKLLEQQHEWEHIIPDPPQPPKGPECQSSLEHYRGPMPDRKKLIKEGLIIEEKYTVWEDLCIGFKSLFK